MGEDIVSELTIREEILDIKYSDYIVIGGGEVGDIDKYIDRMGKMRMLFAIIGLATLGLAFTSLFTIRQVYVFIGLILYVLACFLVMVKEKLIMWDMDVIRENVRLDIEEPIDVFIFSREGKYVDKAKRMVCKVLKEEIESQEFLIMGSPRIIVMDIMVDALYLLGTLAIASIYMFLSIATFLVLGFCLLYIILELTGKIVDLAATL